MTADCFPGITLCYDAWWEGAGTGAVHRGNPPIWLFLPRWSGVEWTGGFVSFLLCSKREDDAIGDIEIKFDSIQA